MNLIAQELALQQLTSHILAWAAIPVALTVNSPIQAPDGSGSAVPEQLAQFASQIRDYERALLVPLKVNQGVLDYFMGCDGKYAAAFSYADAQWLHHDCRPQVIMDDMEPLSVALRNLEAALTALSDNPVPIGREVTRLRTIIASRAGWAEEVSALIDGDPREAVSIFYDNNLRAMRQVHPLTGALSVYHSRRPSFRPSSET